MPTDYRFTGQRADDSTGLYFYGARYYDAGLGRFISPDSIVPSPGNPQDLNRCAYTRNNPVKNTDPSGHRVVVGLDAEGNAIYEDDSARERRIEDEQQYLTQRYNTYLTDNDYAVLQDMAEENGARANGTYGCVACTLDEIASQKGNIDLTKAFWMVAGSLFEAGADPFEPATPDHVQVGGKRGGGSTTLWRAVKDSELADIGATGQFNPSPYGSEGKYFSETPEGAAQFAKIAYSTFPEEGPYTLVRTDIAKGAITSNMRYVGDGGIPTVVIPNRLLQTLGFPKIFPYMPIPRR